MISQSHRKRAPRGDKTSLSCPNCGADLAPAFTDMGYIHSCPRCRGRAVSVAVLRRILGIIFVRNLWVRARAIREGRGKHCPECGRAMCEVVAAPRRIEVNLDVCVRCQLVWFDAKELDEVHDSWSPSVQSSAEMREAVAEAQSKLAAISSDRDGGSPSSIDESPQSPSEQWKWVPAFFGMLVEHGNPRLQSVPYVTYAAAAAIVLIFASTWSNLPRFVQDYGFVPADCLRLGGLTFLTGCLLHGNIYQLLVNVYFLLVFGDNVEDDLGHGRFVVLLLLSSLAASITQIAADPWSKAPCLGAAGGISGIVAYYALRFPRARLGLLWPGPFIFVSLRTLFTAFLGWSFLPAIVALFGWIVLQIAISAFTIDGQDQGSGIAYLGGAAVGAAAWILIRYWSPEESVQTR
jgi:membrane associated rhomboid family serine protease/Zn-finger nucleic acid-binding protein